MTRASNLLDKLFAKNSQKLHLQKCFATIKSLLPPYLAEQVAYMFVKNRTLYFALKNPTVVTELNYKLNYVKEALKLLQQEGAVCCGADFVELRAYTSQNNVEFEIEAAPPVKIHEFADGEFENCVTGEVLHGRIEAIRELIKKRRS